MNRAEYVQEYVTFEIILWEGFNVKFCTQDQWSEVGDDELKPLGFIASPGLVQVCPERIDETCDLMDDEIFCDYMMTVIDVINAGIAGLEVGEFERAQLDDQLGLYA